MTMELSTRIHIQEQGNSSKWKDQFQAPSQAFQQILLDRFATQDPLPFDPAPSIAIPCIKKDFVM